MNLTKNIEISDKLYAKLQDCVKQLISADINNKIKKIGITGGFLKTDNDNTYHLVNNFLYLTVFVERFSDLDESPVSDLIIDYQEDKISDIHVVIDVSPMEDLKNDYISYVIWSEEMRGD